MKLDSSIIHQLRDALLHSGRRPTMVISPASEMLARLGMLSPEESAAVNQVDPMGEVMFLMMAADGNVSTQEREVLLGAVRGLTNNLVRSGTFKVLLESYQKRLDEQGRPARLQEVAEAFADEPSVAEAAFALAAAVALADDVVAPQESELIVQLAEWLQIADQRREEILGQLRQSEAE